MGVAVRSRRYASSRGKRLFPARDEARVPAAGDRRRGDRGRRRDPALGLADDRAARGRARAALRRVRPGRARARGRVRDGRAAPGAARGRRRARRRGDHDADHLARDRERDRPRRRDSGLRRRARLRPEHRPRPRRRARSRDKTKAIVPVDLAGQPADLDPLLAHGIPLVEDAAHAAESAYRGRKIGSIAEATCFSLYATKNIAAGEGGLISTNDSKVAEAIENLRLMRRGDGSLYDIVVPGYKANLSDVLASIALVQLDKVERHGEIRRRQFAMYDEAVAELDGIEPLARDPRDTHALPPVRRPDRRRARRRHPRRVPAAARGREHRDEHPLPPGPQADRVPRAPARPAAAARGGACRRRDPVASALPRALGRRHRRRDRRARPCALLPDPMKRRSASS